MMAAALTTLVLTVAGLSGWLWRTELQHEALRKELDMARTPTPKPTPTPTPPPGGENPPEPDSEAQ